VVPELVDESGVLTNLTIRIISNHFAMYNIIKQQIVSARICPFWKQAA